MSVSRAVTPSRSTEKLRASMVSRKAHAASSSLRLSVLAVLSVLALPCHSESQYTPLPVEQRQAVDTDYPSAVIERGVSSSSVGVSASPYPAPAEAVNTAVQVSQPIISSNEQWELYSQIQQMQEELQTLRGLLEQQTHEIEQMKKQQRDRYLDLDHRLGQLKRLPLQNQDVKPAIPSVDAPMQELSAEEQAAKDTKQYNAAYQLIKEKKFNEAISALQALLADSPDGKKAPYCEFWLGELYLAISPPDLDRARSHFVTLLTKYPGHRKVADGMYKLGTVFNKAGDKANARVTLKRVIKDHAGSQAAKLAQKYMKGL